MKSTKLSSLLNAALGLTLGTLPLAVHATALNAGDILTIQSGISTGGVKTVSWFAMDSGDGNILDSEKFVLRSGTNGIVIGALTTAGAFHPGGQTGPLIPANVDTGAILKSWSYFGQTGTNYNDVAITGDTVAGLNMSGWKVAWNAVASINMSTGAWTPIDAAGAGVQSGTYTNGLAKLSWSGACGDPYTLDYAATVPNDGLTSFGGVPYFIHLSGFALTSACAGVVTTLPVDLQTILSASDTTSFAVTFNEAINPASVTSAFLSVSGGVTVGTPAASGGNKIFTFPLTGVAGGVTYTVTANTAGVTAVSGNPVIAATAYPRTFTTFADSTAPTVVSTTPANGATIAPNTGTVSVTFSEPVTNVLAGAISMTGGVTFGAPTSSNSNKTWTFPITSGNLSLSTGYTLSFNAGPTDPSGNPLTLPASVAFTTSAGANPTLSAVTHDKLRICPGSKFGMEVSPSNPIFTSITEQNPITIGVAQVGAGIGHSGAPTGAEAAVIDKAWSFFGNTGIHFTQSAIADNGNGTMNFGGWRVAWNSVASINMGGGLPATFTWDGVYGHNYTLTYLAVVPLGDPSGFGGVNYTLNLIGKVEGGPSNVTAACDASPISPSGVTIGSGSGTPVVNSQIRPDDPLVIAAGYSTAGRPSDLDFYKYGLITYTISGVTAGQVVPVTFTLPQNVPVGTRVFKVGTDGYQEITSQVTVAGATITLNIQDDGPLDICKVAQGCNAGVIVDPIAIGTPLATATSGDAGGGGCVYNPNGKLDPTLLLVLLGSVGFLGWRRSTRNK